MNLQIALLQMGACGTDWVANQQKGEAFCRRAHAMGADLVLFPEMWSIGYTPAHPAPRTPPDLWQAPERSRDLPPAPLPDLRLIWQGQAISRQHPFIRHFQGVAKELKMAIALTYLE